MNTHAQSIENIEVPTALKSSLKEGLIIIPHRNTAPISKIMVIRLIIRFVLPSQPDAAHIIRYAYSSPQKRSYYLLLCFPLDTHFFSPVIIMIPVKNLLRMIRKE